MWRHQLVQLQFFKGQWVCGGVIGRRGRWKGGGPAEQLCCVCATRPTELKASGAISHREWSTNGDELWGTPTPPTPPRCTVPFDSAERCPDVSAAQLIVWFVLGCFHLLPSSGAKSLDGAKSFNAAEFTQYRWKENLLVKDLSEQSGIQVFYLRILSMKG